MAVRLLTPGMVFLDNSGNPLDSGKIYTYITGTTTNKDTYTDETEGATNANPVVLDSQGRADIWLATDQAYRIVVKTSADVTLDTVDNVVGPFDYTANDFELGGDIKFQDAKGIRDDSGNEHLIFQKTASAVNYFEMTNAATTNDVIFGIAGSDTNVGVDFQTKGTGDFSFNSGVNITGATAITGALTATSYGGITEANLLDKTAAEVITGDWDFGGASSLEIPNAAAPTVDAAGEIAIDTTITDHTGLIKYYDGTEELVVVAMPIANLGNTDGHAIKYNATNDEFEMADPTSSISSDALAKFWVAFDGTDGTVDDSYNIDSVTDNGTGNYTVNITTNFANSNYCVVCSLDDKGTGTAIDDVYTVESRDKDLGSVRIIMIVDNAQALSDTDSAGSIFAIGYGDQ